jgi:hypothetical protein
VPLLLKDPPYLPPQRSTIRILDRSCSQKLNHPESKGHSGFVRHRMVHFQLRLADFCTVSLLACGRNEKSATQELYIIIGYLSRLDLATTPLATKESQQRSWKQVVVWNIALRVPVQKLHRNERLPF